MGEAVVRAELAITGSGKSGSQSAGGRLEVTTIEPLRWRSATISIEVLGLDRGHGLEPRVVEDEQIRREEAAHLRLPGVIGAGRVARWAVRQADRLDPLVPSPYSILNDEPEEEPYRWPW
jgi:hypothetical protein